MKVFFRSILILCGLFMITSVTFKTNLKIYMLKLRDISAQHTFREKLVYRVNSHLKCIINAKYGLNFKAYLI